MLAFARPVASYMTRPVHTILVGAPVAEASARLGELNVSSLLVVDTAGYATGVVSRTDLLARPGRFVGELMTQPIVTADASDSVASAARSMWARKIHRVYVLAGGQAAGVFSTRDVMLAVRDEKNATPLSDLMSSPVIAIAVDRPVSEALDLLRRSTVGGLVVVEDEHPVGLFTQSEALAAATLPPTTPVDEVMSPALMCLRTTIPAHRAAAFTVSTRARRIVVIHHHDMKGIVSGMDFVRLAAGAPQPERGLAAG